MGTVSIRSPIVRNHSYSRPMTDFSEQDLSGSGFQQVDLSGSTFRQADMTDLDIREVNFSGTRVRAAYFDGVRMTGVEVPDMEISGEIVRLVVNGVDVVPLVEAELNRQMPERALMAPTTVDGFREAFAITDRLWGETMGRARELETDQLYEPVDGEWSFIETLRHLGFAHACWIGGVVLAQRSPWHPLDLPWDEAPEFEDVPWARPARPELHEVMALRRQRRNTVAEVLDGLTDAGLDRSVTSATQFMTDATGLTVADCLRVVLNEEWQHRLYAERDLAKLAS
jgi:hypothetical protein